ncbi:unnamed protein product [Rhodiola kirilowii]
MERSLGLGKMIHFLLKHPFAFALALHLFPSSIWGHNTPTGSMTYHNGPVLTGNINLAILWYGRFDLVEKERIFSFIESLNHNGQIDLEPSISSWWKVVESYQSAVLGAAPKKSSRIKIHVVSQVNVTNYFSGHDIDTPHFPRLLQLATNGTHNVIPVIFASKDVRVNGICTAACYVHGFQRETKKSYLVIANPELMCPEKCAWPYHRGAMALQGFTLQPQSGDIGADAMLIQFASGLVNVITDPMQTGFVRGDNGKPLQVSNACKTIFGSGAFPGFTGKIRLDPRTGGVFNAHGKNGAKFLLPALWNPLSSSCWTPM